MAQSTYSIFYLTAGAAVFSHIEGWLFADGEYRATITPLTIGYGDIEPVTHLGRSLIIPYALSRITMLGLVAGSVGSLVLDRAAQKVNARWILMERKQRAVHAEKPHPEDATDMEKERLEFMIMRQIQSRARSKQRWTLLIISTIALMMLWLLGAAVFWATENWKHSFSF